MRIYRNCVLVIVNLCKQNNTSDRLGLFTKLCALLVMSGLLFLRTVRGVMWELIVMTEDVSSMAEYNLLQVVWSFLVEVIEEIKEKIQLKKNL